jgi:heme/copper-type cytochrome/quinol oxidase subunit 2
MKNASIFVVIAILFIAGIGMGYIVGFTGVKPAPTSAVQSTTIAANSTITSKTTATITSNVTTTVQNNSTPFDLTLAITTNNFYNKTYNPQPAYYVVTPNGLSSAANITLPANTLIKLVIINYDDGSAPLLMNDAANVSGTQNNMESVVNNNNVNSSQGSTGINIVGGQQVSSINPSNIAHTFSIPELNVNLPIPPSSVVTAYLTLNDTGTFTWACLTGCGYGIMGTMGAMSTSGWMEGSLTVSNS